MRGQTRSALSAALACAVVGMEALRSREYDGGSTFIEEVCLFVSAKGVCARGVEAVMRGHHVDVPRLLLRMHVFSRRCRVWVLFFLSLCSRDAREHTTGAEQSAVSDLVHPGNPVCSMVTPSP